MRLKRVGLAVQHLVDPQEVPLSPYPTLYEALFGPIATPGQEAPSASKIR